MKIAAGRFLWGSFFILLGLTCLGVLAGYIDSGFWITIIQFWPAIIILWGLRLIIKNNFLFSLVGIFLVLAVFSLSILSNSNSFGFRITEINDSPTITKTYSYPIKTKMSNISLEISTGASIVELSELSDNESKTAYSIVSENIPALTVDNVESSSQELLTSRLAENTNKINLLNTKNTSRKIIIYLNKNLLTNIILNSGASKVTLDLSKIKTEKISISSGASDIDIKIGALNRSVLLNISSGASKISVFTPNDFGLSVNSQSGLSNVRLNIAKKYTSNRGQFTTNDYVGSQKKLNVNLESGLTNLVISQ